MKKPGPPAGPPSTARSGRKGRLPSDTETALWRHTASTLQPLRGAKSRVHAALEDVPPATPSQPGGSTPNLKRGASPPRPVQLAPVRAATPSPSPEPRKPPPLADFDSKRARKLRTGQVEIDARIDLHGMRQSEAHTALRGFLHASHRRGHSVVLVITGKGAPAGARPDASWGDALGRSERGILRRNVPQWLSDPDLRAIVVSFAPAAIRHGGDGALYVHLRRLRP
jgi:DNA-nicking Smr family endonuclease